MTVLLNYNKIIKLSLVNSSSYIIRNSHHRNKYDC